MNTTRSIAVFASLLLACGMDMTAQADKLRVVILTDISNEPDDQQSLVRFLTYANEFDVEGLIATTSCWRRNKPDKPTILQVLDAYEKALPNLRKHAAGYPEADALRRVTKAGVDGFGMSAAAEQLDNEGIRHIVIYSDASDRWTYAGQPYHNEYATVFRWRQAFQNDFAARMDWCVADDFKNAHHNPVAVLNGDRTKRVLPLTAKPGDTVTLSAEGTQDPDGDALDVCWWIYPEAGTLPTGADGKSPVTLSAEQGSRTTLVASKVGNPETLHVILEVCDAGTPPLFAYRRAVITIQP